MSRPLEGRVALVTGSSAGLGKAVALRLGQAGARVVLNYHQDDARGQAALEEARAAGVEAVLLKADVTCPEAVHRLAGQILGQLGPVDILVLNASRAHPQRPLAALSWADYQRGVDDFLKAPVLLCQALVPLMTARRWGRVIAIGSDVLSRTVNHYTAYVAGKGALHGFARSLATELAPTGVTVNTVAPGWVPVERHLAEPGYAEKRRQYEQHRVPMGRVGEVSDVAEAVLYFAGEGAAFVTGQVLCVNGGVSLM